MAGRVIAPTPTLDRATQTVTLEDVQYRLTLTWRARPAGWYLDLYLLDGTPVALGRRLCAGFPVVIGGTIANAPPGMLFVRGSDGYARADLGVSLFLIYYSAAEITAARSRLGTVVEDDLVITAGEA